MNHLLRAVAIGLFALAAAPIFALSGSGDSAAGSLDTVAPTPGTATVPPSGVITGESIPYVGASDASGIARFELWARKDSTAWYYYDAVFDGLANGSFFFAPGGTGLYHFDLVAEDSVGNRSAAPLGSAGTGQGSTNFASNVADWSLLDQ
ncbi:hypothetical protein GC173_10430 [bacterium]|nr:hypothetical protein [bacterium]